jgi:hypothetical protein
VLPVAGVSRFLARSRLRPGVTDAQLVRRFLAGESMADLGMALCRSGHDGSGCVGACKVEVQDRIRRRMRATHVVSA